MEKKKLSILKIVMVLVFAGLVFGAFFYQIFGKFPEDSVVKKVYLEYGCICLCFLLSLIFISFKSNKFFVTLALATNVAADYFLVLMPSESHKLIGLYIFCGVQFCYLIYTLFLNQSIGIRVVNLALRVALCLLAYFLLPNYVTLSTLEMVAVMYILNSFVTLLVLLTHLKTDWLMFLGFLLFFACDIFVGFTNGGITLFKLTGPFVEFITKYDIAFFCYIPGIFLIAVSSIFPKKNK